MQIMLKKRIFMTVAGVLLSGFSVGMFQYSSLGMDPFQVFAHGIWNQLEFIKTGQGIRLLMEYDPSNPVLSYGTVYMVINLILLVLDFFLDRKKIGIATFINLFLLGYVVDFSHAIWQRLLPEPGILLRILFLLLGVVIMCFASALYFTGNLGVSTYDAIALTLSEKKSWDFRIVRIVSDLIVTGIGFLFGILPGIGTIITAFFMGPLIVFFRKKVAEPFLYGKKETGFHEGRHS